MANIFIIHGTYGHPGENWFPWLKKELETLGHTVFVPHFPSPPEHSLSSWMNMFKEYKEQLNEDTILIGHSVGCGFILNVLERLEQPIKAAYLVAGFVGKINIEKFDILNKTFAEKDFDWESISKNCNYFCVLNSDNDPYVPIEKGKELAQKLGVEMILVEGAGHFNAEAGYTKFEMLLNKIKNLKEKNGAAGI